jgi:hypothetical protein
MSNRKDSDAIIVCDGRPLDDFVTVFTEILGNIQFKLFALILIMFLILHTDIFVKRILNKFQGAVDMNHPTYYGVLLMGLFLVIGCICLDAAISQKIV